MSMMWTAVALTRDELATLCNAANPFEELGAISKDRCCELEKAWDAAHWLIAEGAETGADFACFIKWGGREVPAIDVEYGPARFFEPQAVSSIREVVSAWTRDRLTERWDTAHIQLKELYPFAGGGHGVDDNDRDYVLRRFDSLRDFLARIDGQNLGLLVFLS